MNNQELLETKKLLENKKIFDDKIKNIISELKKYSYSYEFPETAETTKPTNFNIDIENQFIVVHGSYEEYIDMPEQYYITRSKNIKIPITLDILFSDINLGKWLDLELLKTLIKYHNEEIVWYNKNYLENISRHKSNIKTIQKIIDNYKE